MRIKHILASVFDFLLISVISSTLLLVFQFSRWEFSRSVISGENTVFKIDAFSMVIFIILSFVISAGVIFALACKDLVFRNASIGKKLLGLVILDRNFEIPSRKKLVRRGIRIIFEGFAMIICDLIDKGDFAKWELDRFGTRVIDKNILKKLREEASEMEGNENENLEKLYDEYLRTIYIK